MGDMSRVSRCRAERFDEDSIMGESSSSLEDHLVDLPLGDHEELERIQQPCTGTTIQVPTKTATLTSSVSFRCLHYNWDRQGGTVARDKI